MKEGVTDPFAQDEPADEPAESTSQTDESYSPVQPEPSEPVTGSDATEDTASSTGQYDRSDLPRILTRNKVKDDRDDVHQLFVYEDTHQQEKEARRELKDRLGDDLYKLDIREAIYLAGMENIDDAEAILREWGADI